MHRMGWGLSAGLISTHYTCLGEPQAADVLGGWGRAPCPPGWSLWGLQPALGHDLIASCEAGVLMPPEPCPQGPSVCSRKKSGAVWRAVLFLSALDCVLWQAALLPPSRCHLDSPSQTLIGVIPASLPLLGTMFAFTPRPSVLLQITLLPPSTQEKAA